MRLSTRRPSFVVPLICSIAPTALFGALLVALPMGLSGCTNDDAANVKVLSPKRDSDAKPPSKPTNLSVNEQGDLVFDELIKLRRLAHLSINRMQPGQISKDGCVIAEARRGTCDGLPGTERFAALRFNCTKTLKPTATEGTAQLTLRGVHELCEDSRGNSVESIGYLYVSDTRVSDAQSMVDYVHSPRIKIKSVNDKRFDVFGAITWSPSSTRAKKLESWKLEIDSSFARDEGSNEIWIERGSKFNLAYRKTATNPKTETQLEIATESPIRFSVGPCPRPQGDFTWTLEKSDSSRSTGRWVADTQGVTDPATGVLKRWPENCAEN